MTHAGRPPHAGVGAVGQRDHHDDVVALRAIERVGEQQPGVGRARVADAGGEIVAQRFLLHAGRRGQALDRPSVRAGDDQPRDGGRGDPGALERLGQRRLTERYVGVLAEALLPHARGGFAGQPPAVEKLRGRRGAAQRLGQHARVGRVVGEEERRRAVAAIALVAAARQPGADVAEHGQRGAPRVARRAHGADRRAHGADDVHGEGRGRQIERGVNGGRVGLVEIGRVGGREVERLGHDGGAAQRCPPGLDAQRGRVLVVGGHGTGAAAGGHPERLGDRLAVQAPVGQVGSVADDPSHSAPILPRTGGAVLSGAGGWLDVTMAAP